MAVSATSFGRLFHISQTQIEEKVWNISIQWAFEAFFVFNSLVLVLLWIMEIFYNEVSGDSNKLENLFHVILSLQ